MVVKQKFYKSQRHPQYASFNKTTVDRDAKSTENYGTMARNNQLFNHVQQRRQIRCKQNKSHKILQDSSKFLVLLLSDESIE